MKTLLVLARGDFKSFHTLANISIIKDMPFKIVFLVDRGNRKKLSELEGNFELEVIRWSEEAELKKTAIHLHDQHQFCGVATVDESNVEMASELRALLNLPGMKPDQAVWFRDKVKMKNKVKGHGIRVPEFVSCTQKSDVYALLKTYGKLVIKPVDGFGSKQVVFSSSRQELDAWFNENEQYAINYEAEEYIDGQLFHVNALVVDGKTQLTAAAEYLPGLSNIDFSAGTPFVSMILEEGEIKQSLIKYSALINESLALQNGVTHLECFITDKQEIVFCEIGLRPGGGGIVWMIESQFGINYNQAVLAIEAGVADILPVPNLASNSVSGLIGIRSNISGFVTQSASVEDFDEPNIRLKHIELAPGAFKAASSHCTDFFGLFIFDSYNGEQFNQKWKKINQKFQEKLVLNCI